MIASLPMYDHPEILGATNRYWALIRSALVEKGIDAPEMLTRDESHHEIWTSSELVFSQTCGLPYRTTLHDKVQLVGTPDMGVTQCPPGYYRSVFITRASESRTEVEDFLPSVLAINSHDSQSGHAAMRQHVSDSLGWFKDVKVSGSHASSAQMVATGKADLAALDAVSWRQIQQYDNIAHRLKVLSWSEPTPGLPYICAPAFDTDIIFSAVEIAIGKLSNNDQALLGIQNIVLIDKQIYLDVGNST